MRPLPHSWAQPKTAARQPDQLYRGAGWDY